MRPNNHEDPEEAFFSEHAGILPTSAEALKWEAELPPAQPDRTPMRLMTKEDWTLLRAMGSKIG
jgi:hypothetical protein